MTELEILEHAHITIDRIWGLGQWYVAISLAIVSASHFASARLNPFVLTAIVCLYSVYTVFMGSAYLWNFHVMSGYFEALERVDPSNIEVMQPVYDGLAYPYNFAPTLYPIIGIAIYIACTTFLIGTYIQERRKDSGNPEDP